MSFQKVRKIYSYSQLINPSPLTIERLTTLGLCKKYIFYNIVFLKPQKEKHLVKDENKESKAAKATSFGQLDQGVIIFDLVIEKRVTINHKTVHKPSVV